MRCRRNSVARVSVRGRIPFIGHHHHGSLLVADRLKTPALPNAVNDILWQPDVSNATTNATIHWNTRTSQQVTPSGVKGGMCQPDVLLSAATSNWCPRLLLQWVGCWRAHCKAQHYRCAKLEGPATPFFNFIRNPEGLQNVYNQQHIQYL